MKITLFGSTGGVGSQCLTQALDAGHDVTVLVRDAKKLPEDVRGRITVVEGDALQADDVAQSLKGSPDAVVFALGVTDGSPRDICTDVTRHILNNDVKRLVWCGGGSTILPEDDVTSGARFVQVYSKLFMNKRHEDKKHQYTLLQKHTDVQWLGIRPLQIFDGPLTGEYRLGYDAFSGGSKISFADCAHALLRMLEDDTWMHKAPIIQY